MGEKLSTFLLFIVQIIGMNYSIGMSKFVDYTIVYSKRKTISINIFPDKSVIVKAPIGVSKNQINDIVDSKKKWIINKIKEAEEREKLEEGKLMYLGTQYQVDIKVQRHLKKAFVIFYNDKIIVNVRSEGEVKEALEKWIKERTRDLILNSIDRYIGNFKIKPKDITIKEQKNRWGSCTYDNRLLFNNKLSMATNEAVEYVVVHEMCHMIHKNHSKDFWSEVERILPDYKYRHQWLKEKGHLIKIK